MTDSSPSSSPRVGVILLAGGVGARAGFARPKQLEPLGSKPVLRWSLDAFAAHPDRQSTRLKSVTNAQLVCRLLLEKKKNTTTHNNTSHKPRNCEIHNNNILIKCHYVHNSYTDTA